jgi:hypothetical protein
LSFHLGCLFGPPLCVCLKVGNLSRNLLLKLDKSVGRQQSAKLVSSRNHFVDIRFLDRSIALAA